MKYLAVLIMVGLMLIWATPVLADGGIDVEVTIIGDDPHVGVGINGQNPLTGVFIHGDNPQTYVDIDGNGGNLIIDGHDIDQTISNAVNGAVQQATPNSVWSSTSTGILPPLGLIPAVNAVAPGKYTQPVVGGYGYLGPKTNENPYVYKGAGCGMWGVSDGYPDLWGRRQMVGVTVDLTIQREKLEQTQMALVKVIGEIQKGNMSVETINSQLGVSLDTLSGVVTDLSVMEEENLQFREQTTKQINDLYKMITFLIIFVIIGILAAIAGFAILAKSRKSY